MANTLTFANLTLTDANIFGGIRYIVDLNAGEEFTIGNTASACVSFTTDTQLPLYSKDNTNGTFVWDVDGTAKGRFYITEVTKGDGKYEITAYDAMILLDTSVAALSLTLPATVSACASAIANYLGCTAPGTIVNGSCSASELDETTTIRLLLSYIAEAAGCSVKINGDDELCFMYYADSGITVTSTDYIELEVADYTCAAIDNVTIYNMEGEVQASAGSGTNSLFIGQNPFLENATSTNATNIYNAVKDFVYAPLTVSMFEENGIEVGTIATFGTTPTLVMHLESGEGGAVVSSVGSDTRAEYNKDIMTTINETREIAVSAQSQASAAATAAAAATTAAGQAQSAASAAQSQASAAASAASAASTAAGNAQTSADAAQASANNANEYAARALGDLGAVQSVAETLAWITQHGTMTLTSDTSPDPSHVYFVVDTNGDYVVGSTHYSVVTEPDASSMSTYYELTLDDSLNNYVATHLVVDGDGLWIIPDSGGNRVLISVGAQGAYSTPGTYIVNSGNVLARFTADGTQVGQSDESYLKMDFHSMQLIDKEGDTYFHVSDLRGANGSATLTYTDEMADTPFVALPYLPESILSVTINGVAATYVEHGQEIEITSPCADGDIIEVIYTTESNEVKAYTFGTRDATAAVGPFSHAEGEEVEASGFVSHAQGYHTKAQGRYQTVIGHHNAPNYHMALIIGNGSADDDRSNAFAVDWAGDIYPRNIKMADFIVENRSSGDWKWRKWYSGRIEAWATHSFGSQTGTSWASQWYKDVTLALPSGLFTSVKVFATSNNSSWAVYGTSVSNGTITIRAVRNASNAANMSINFYCEGA